MLFKAMALSGTFWSELVEFFSPRIEEYENLSIDRTSFVAIQYVIMGIFFGIILAALAAIYNKRVLGDFIRALIKAEANSPESAKTLSELGFSRNVFVKYSLIRGNTLKKSTRCVERDEYERRLASEEESEGQEKKKGKRAVYALDFRPDASSARFYIPEEKKYEMEIKFDAKGTNWLTFAVTVVVSLVLVGVTVLFLPDILRFVDNCVSVMRA